MVKPIFNLGATQADAGWQIIRYPKTNVHLMVPYGIPCNFCAISLTSKAKALACLQTFARPKSLPRRFPIYIGTSSDVAEHFAFSRMSQQPLLAIPGIARSPGIGIPMWQLDPASAKCCRSNHQRTVRHMEQSSQLQHSGGLGGSGGMPCTTHQTSAKQECVPVVIMRIQELTPQTAASSVPIFVVFVTLPARDARESITMGFVSIEQ
jgi:hypothetical protein